jgi:hypothetical protein
MSTDLSRSQLRVKILEQTGGSIDELRKLKQQLRSRAFSKEGRSQDKKMLSVVGDLLKKRERDELIKQQESAGKDDMSYCIVANLSRQVKPPRNKPLKLSYFELKLVDFVHLIYHHSTSMKFETVLSDWTVGNYDIVTWNVVSFTYTIISPVHYYHYYYY